MAAGEADPVQLRTRIVEAARGWLGTPYCHQASARGAGCDCLGLIRGVWREVLGPEPEGIPPYDAGWFGRHTEDRLLEGLDRHFRARAARPVIPGTVLLFRAGPGRRIRHAGISASGSSLIHALSGHGVREEALEPVWGRRLAAQFEFPDTDGTWQL